VIAASAARRDLVLGACAIGGGLAVAWLAAGIRGMPGQPFSPGFVPGIVGVLAAVVGLVLVLRAVAGRAPPLAEEDTEGHGRPLRLAAAWVLGGIAAAALLFEALGFLPLMILWLAGFQLLLGVRPLPAVALAAIMAFAVDEAFVRILGVPLPPGEWLIALGWA
jgi:putative tricarboxylic transport membrane protein